MASRELVIKIPNNYDLSKIQNGSIASKTILNAVANGTPLNEVLDKIKDEIVNLGQRTMNDNRANGIWACRDIIDKYRTKSGE